MLVALYNRPITSNPFSTHCRIIQLNLGKQIGGDDSVPAPLLRKRGAGRRAQDYVIIPARPDWRWSSNKYPRMDFGVPSHTVWASCCDGRPDVLPPLLISCLGADTTNWRPKCLIFKGYHELPLITSTWAVWSNACNILLIIPSPFNHSLTCHIILFSILLFFFHFFLFDFSLYPLSLPISLMFYWSLSLYIFPSPLSLSLSSSLTLLLSLVSLLSPVSLCLSFSFLSPLPYPLYTPSPPPPPASSPLHPSILPSLPSSSLLLSSSSLALPPSLFLLPSLSFSISVSHKFSVSSSDHF